MPSMTISDPAENWRSVNFPFNNFTAALSRGAGWGYFDPGNGAGGQSALGNYSDGYQNVPINWGINTPRKRGFFDLLSKVTGA